MFQPGGACQLRTAFDFMNSCVLLKSLLRVDISVVCDALKARAPLKAIKVKLLFVSSASVLIFSVLPSLLPPTPTHMHTHIPHTHIVHSHPHTHTHRRANEHLQPMLQLCHPCSVDYDVYISFKHLPDDAFRVLDMFDIPHEYYRNIENHPEYATSDLVELYFGNMSDVERMEKMAALNDQGDASINDSPPSRYAFGGGGEYIVAYCVYCVTCL